MIDLIARLFRAYEAAKQRKDAISMATLDARLTKLEDKYPYSFDRAREIVYGS